MSHLLNSGSVGNIGLNHMKDVRKKVQEKWDTTGFLTGLQGHVKENVAQLFENQAGSLLTESTGAENSGSFETVVFPIVRRVFSKLLANDIVSVQAMNLPIGKLFFFVPVTSNRIDENGNAGDFYNSADSAWNGGANGYSAHTSMAADQLPTCVAGSCSATTFELKNLYDVFYNDGMFDNSKGRINLKFFGGLQKFALDAAGNMSMIPFDGTALAAATDGTVREIILGVTGFTSTGAGQLTGPDGDPMDTESFLASLKVITGTQLLDPNGAEIYPVGSSVPFRVVTQKYGKGIVDYTSICDATGTIYVGVDTTHPVDINADTTTFDGYIGMSGATLSVSSGTTWSAGWVEYSSLELETEMGEVSFRLDDVVVSVEERKLRATWSPELAQDVSAFHNIDAEAELTALLSEQVASEIDREILRDLRKLGAWQMRWDYYGWRKASLAANAYTQKDWNQTLITKVNQISAQIHKSTLRGGANFIVVSSEISAIFDDLEYFHVSDASPDQDQYNMGIERIGSLGGRYQVYRDPYAPSYSMVIGHKGKSLLDTGYIYAPYVPMQLTPTMYNPFNFAPVKGIMTRYAKKSVNNRFYGHVRVDGVPTFNVNELR